MIDCREDIDADRKVKPKGKHKHQLTALRNTHNSAKPTFESLEGVVVEDPVLASVALLGGMRARINTRELIKVRRVINRSNLGINGRLLLSVVCGEEW